MAEAGDNSMTRTGSNGGDHDPDEEFIRSFTQSQRPLFLYLLPLLGNPADADEVLQETNLVIWKKRADFQSGTNFLAWGRTIARLEVFRFRRNRGRKLTFLEQGILESVAEQAESIGDETELRQDALNECMKQLKPKDRELLQMRYAAGANGDKVAQQLGRPANSVYQSLGRIRRVLMDCVQHRLAGYRLKEEGGLS